MTLNMLLVPSARDRRANLPIKVHQVQLWDSFFRTNKAVFRDTQVDLEGNYIRGGPGKYCFKYHIQTDGVSCSILLTRFERKEFRFSGRAPKLVDPYIDDVVDEVILAELRKKIHVGIDPGIQDLLYAVDAGCRKPYLNVLAPRRPWRYTSIQRIRESNRKRRSAWMRKKMNEVLDIPRKFRLGATLSCKRFQWKYLRLVYPKSLSYPQFKFALEMKLIAMETLLDFYEHRQFRVNRAYAFAGKQRTEARMVKSFKERFLPVADIAGQQRNPNELCIFFGNWSKRTGMRFQGPVPSLGLRRLLRRHGFLVYLVKESYTSKTCYQCKQRAFSNPMRYQNPRPWMRATSPMVRCHGLIKCNSCQTYWNRDRNGALNILDIGIQWLYHQTRPVHLEANGVADVVVD